MDRNLIEETKSFLDLIQSYQQDLSTLRFGEKGIDTVNGHLQKSINESEEAAEKILDNIRCSLEYLEQTRALCLKLHKDMPNPDVVELEGLLDGMYESILENLTLMEFQDILVQRLIKSSTLLGEIKGKLLKLILLLGINESGSEEERQQMEAKLHEIAWEKEVDQNDVDEILKQFGI